MHLNQYLPLALRTESPRIFGHVQKTSRLLHAAVGICTEVAELAAHSTALNLKEEIGDICWYLAIGMDTLGMKVPDCFRPVASGTLPYHLIASKLVINSGDLLDLLKKHAFYGKSVDEDMAKRHLVRTLELVIEMCDDRDFDLSDVLEANIRKLTARYPEKFAETRAHERDLTAEAKALEG